MTTRGPDAYLKVTPYSLAHRYIGTHEQSEPGKDNPLIVAWLNRVAPWATSDEVAWCAAFVFNFAWELDLPRPNRKDGLNEAAARSWLRVGSAVVPEKAVRGFDVVILKRGGGNQPGPETLTAQGHVGFFDGLDTANRRVSVLGGNQNDSVSIANFSFDQILGVRRL